MKRILSWIIMVPFALVVIVFSAVNRELITLDLWPLPHAITVPVFTLVLAVFIFGFLWVASPPGHRRPVAAAARAMRNGGRKRRSANSALSTTSSRNASVNWKKFKPLPTRQ